MQQPTPPITSIKGFNQDFTCRGYQFAEGETYTHEGTVKACSGGFHACSTEAHPLEVFQYYAPAGSRFHEVVQSGDIHSDDGIKISASVITIGVEIPLSSLIKRAVDWVFAKATPENSEHVTTDRALASSTGVYGAASSTGDYGAASSTGDYGAASSTGTRGAASSTGYQGAASSTGYQGAASSTGDYGAASSTGDQGAASSTGDYGAAMSSGYGGKVMGADGNALFAVERNYDYEILSVAAGIVGRDGIKAGVWYKAKAGQLVEA